MIVKNNRVRRALLVLVAVFGTLAIPVWAKQSKEVQALLENAETIIAVSGTSTLHDWTVTTRTVDGKASLETLLDPAVSWKNLEASANGTLPLSIDVTIPVQSMVSGKGGMDKIMYKTLDKEHHPQITYRLMEAKPKTNPEPGAGDNHLVLETTGELTVAGTAYTLAADMKLERLEDNRIRISGLTPMKMTDFKMKPPKAMMGMIKSGDDVEVMFRWTVPTTKD